MKISGRKIHSLKFVVSCNKFFLIKKNLSMQLNEILEQRIVILDGAMGTMIQRYKLSEEDYRGERFRDWKGKDLKGSLELLQLTQAQVIEEIHTKYLEAGAD